MQRNLEGYTVEIRPLSDADGGGYLAELPELPGCFADGETPDEAYEDARGALESYLESLRNHGEAIPASATATQLSPGNRSLTVGSEKH